MTVIRISKLRTPNGDFAAYIAAVMNEDGEYKLQDLKYLGATPDEAGQYVHDLLHSMLDAQNG